MKSAPLNQVATPRYARCAIHLSHQHLGELANHRSIRQEPHSLGFYSRLKPLLRVGQHPSPSALPSTAGGVRELREDCLSEASSAAPAQLASRAGDRRRQPTTVMRGAFSLSPLSLWASKEKGGRPAGRNQCHEHLRERAIHRAISQRPQNLIAVETAPTSARSVAVRPAPTGQATCPPCRARRNLCGNKPFGPSGRGHVTQSRSEVGLRERY